MNKLFEFFQEDNGGFSSARLITLLFASAIIFKYVWQIVHTNDANFSMEEITMMLGSFGIKAGQKYVENKPTDTTITVLGGKP